MGKIKEIKEKEDEQNKQQTNNSKANIKSQIMNKQTNLDNVFLTDVANSNSNSNGNTNNQIDLNSTSNTISSNNNKALIEKDINYLNQPAKSIENDLIEYIEDIIGNKIVEENEYLVREYKLWVEIYEKYKRKVPGFHKYINSITYRNVFNKINKAFTAIKEKVINVRIKMDDKLFLFKLKEEVEKSGKESHSDILNVIDNPLVTNTLQIDNYEFQSSSSFHNTLLKEVVQNLNLHFPVILKNKRKSNSNNYNIANKELIQEFNELLNIESIRKAIQSENNLLSNHIDKMKTNLDYMTDVLENECLLNYDKLEELVEYLDNNKNYLASNIK